MIGIYDENFLDYLKENLGEPIKVNNSNIICRCPWCEMNKDKKHYHLWISLEAPIFRCFFAGCQSSGSLKKLFKKISGNDSSDKYVDKNKIKENVKKKIFSSENIDSNNKNNIVLSELKEDQFKLKTLYMKKRLGFSDISLSRIKGLIFDVDSFIRDNNIELEYKHLQLKDYLHSNFVGFLTEHKSVVIFRNIDPQSSFRHFKLKIGNTHFLDYYKINGNRDSNNIILSEGTFDIILEHINDTIGLKSNVLLYSAALSTSYDSLIKSIVFDTQVFRPNVIILSDRDVNLNFYKKLKNFNSHIINSLVVYYNKIGKDFGNLSVIPERIVI